MPGEGRRRASAYGSSLTADHAGGRNDRQQNAIHAALSESFKTRNVSFSGGAFRGRIADYGDGRFGLPFVEAGFARQLGGCVGVESGGHKS